MSGSNSVVDLSNAAHTVVTVVKPEVGLEIPTGFCRVASLQVGGKPLAIRVPGSVATNVAASFGVQSFFLELSPNSIKQLNAIESIYFERYPEIAEFFKFKSCLIDDNLIRVKLPASQTGRRFQFTCDHTLTPQDTSALTTDKDIVVTFEPRFYFMDGTMGLFLKTIHLQLHAKK